MTKYLCGHESNGIVILDDNVMSLMAYEDWSNTFGVFGDKSICWECYVLSNKRIEVLNEI